MQIATTGSDRNPCSASRPCATMAHAYKVAKPGQRILLAAGQYEAQSVDVASSRSGRPVIFEPAGGQAVLPTLSIHSASNMIIRRLVVSGELLIENEHPERDGSTNVTLDRDSAKTLRLIGRISKITVRGGSYGNAVNSQPQIKKYNPTDPDSSQPTQILVDGASFHDFRRSDNSVHTECLQILNGNRITIRNSRFWNCDGTGDIGITPTGLITDLTLENNFIGGGGDTGYGIQIGMHQRNFVFRFNSSSQSVFFADSRSDGPYTFVGNYMPWDYSLCNSSANYRNNVLSGGKCGSSDVTVPSLQFVDAKNHDLHLSAGSNAIGRGVKGERPAHDIDGDTRPGPAFAPDAGADQRETALLVLGRSIGGVTLGASETGLTSFYGRGRSGNVRLGPSRIKRITYRLHRGSLWAYVDKGTVVGAATSSAYYQTASGLGPSSTATPGALRGFRWVPCLSAYSRVYHGAAVRLVTTKGQRGGVIRVVYVLKPSYGGCSR
jgi:hypothetical protein